MAVRECRKLPAYLAHFAKALKCTEVPDEPVAFCWHNLSIGLNLLFFICHLHFLGLSYWRDNW